MDNNGMKIIFTSFRDSQILEGLKLSIDRVIPRLCSYPVITCLLMPNPRNLKPENIERIYNSILDNNWELIQDLVNEVHGLGVNQIVFCDWTTKEQIANGKFCGAGMIGHYIKGRVASLDGFEFEVEIEYRDGREVL